MGRAVFDLVVANVARHARTEYRPQQQQSDHHKLSDEYVKQSRTTTRDMHSCIVVLMYTVVCVL